MHPGARLLLCLSAAALGLASASSLAAQEGQPSTDEIARRLLDLERQSAALLKALDPVQRAEVLEQLGALRSQAAAAAGEPDQQAEPQPPSTAAAAIESDARPEAGMREPEPSAAPESILSATAVPADRTPPSGCAPLARFDSNGDGVLSGADRLWRHFYLETDSGTKNGVLSLFELEIRKVALDVTSFIAKGDSEGFVTRGREYRFQLIGKIARKTSSGLLAVDAGGLARSGFVELRDATGLKLEGTQALAVGQSFVWQDGSSFPAVCR